MRLVIFSTLFMTAEVGLGVLVGTLLRRASHRAPRPPARARPTSQLPSLPRSRRALVS